MILIGTRLWRYALYRAYLNIIGEASKYSLGWLWWFLEPIAMTGVFFVVFTYIRPATMQGFPYFLIIGVTTWLWFANCVSNSTDTLASARAIISQIRLPKLLFPLIAVASATMKQCFVFVIMLIVIGISFGPGTSWFFLPVLLTTQLLLILAASSTTALLCCWVKDVKFIVNSGLTLMMFCSGLFFEIDRMPVDWQYYFRLNPMAVMIEQYRLILLSGTVPDITWCAVASLGSVLWLHSIKWLYKYFDPQLTRRVLT